MVAGIKRRLALATKAHHWFCHFASSSSSSQFTFMQFTQQRLQQTLLNVRIRKETESGLRRPGEDPKSVAESPSNKLKSLKARLV